MAGGQAPRAARPPVPPCPRCLPCPRRLDIALLSFLALVIACCDRVNTSVPAAPSIMQEYGWNTARAGWAAAFWLKAAISAAGILAFLVFGRAERIID